MNNIYLKDILEEIKNEKVETPSLPSVERFIDNVQEEYPTTDLVKEENKPEPIIEKKPKSNKFSIRKALILTIITLIITEIIIYFTGGIQLA